MPRNDQPRLAILGAGPIGLEAALYAAALKLPFTVYERGRVAEHLQQWGHVRLFTPFAMNVTPLGRSRILTEHPQAKLPDDNACITGREHVKAYLEPLANSPVLRDHLRFKHTILHIARKGHLKGDNPGDAKRGQQPFRFVVRDGNNAERHEEADVVLDCTGTYSRHRFLGEGGIPALGERQTAQQLSYQIDDVLGEKKAHYAGKTTLVIGGGYSAATTVVNLAKLAEQHPDTWVIWLARTTGTTPLKRIPGDPLKERDQLALRANTIATRTDANVEFHNQAAIDSVEGAWDRGFKVVGRLGSKPKTWNVERIIANVGCTPDTDLYRELQIHECYASLGPMNLAAALSKHGSGDCLTIPAQGPATLRNPEPNFYLIGMKSYGRNPHFLLKTGFEQVRDVFTLITGKSDLNLYKSGARV
jgi:thioredoxin reductase